MNANRLVLVILILIWSSIDGEFSIAQESGTQVSAPQTSHPDDAEPDHLAPRYTDPESAKAYFEQLWAIDRRRYDRELDNLDYDMANDVDRHIGEVYGYEDDLPPEMQMPEDPREPSTLDRETEEFQQRLDGMAGSCGLPVPLEDHNPPSPFMHAWFHVTSQTVAVPYQVDPGVTPFFAPDSIEVKLGRERAVIAELSAYRDMLAAEVDRLKNEKAQIKANLAEVEVGGFSLTNLRQEVGELIRSTQDFIISDFEDPIINALANMQGDPLLNALNDKLDETEEKLDQRSAELASVNIGLQNKQRQFESYERALRSAAEQEQHQQNLARIRSDAETLAAEEEARFEEALGLNLDLVTQRLQFVEAHNKFDAIIRGYDLLIAETERSDAPFLDSIRHTFLDELKDDRTAVVTRRDQWREMAKISLSNSGEALQETFIRFRTDGIGPANAPELIGEITERGLNVQRSLERFDIADTAGRRARQEQIDEDRIGAATLASGATRTTNFSSWDYAGDFVEDLVTESPLISPIDSNTRMLKYTWNVGKGVVDNVVGLLTLTRAALDVAGETAGVDLFDGNSAEQLQHVLAMDSAELTQKGEYLIDRGWRWFEYTSDPDEFVSVLGRGVGGFSNLEVAALRVGLAARAAKLADEPLDAARITRIVESASEAGRRADGAPAARTADSATFDPEATLAPTYKLGPPPIRGAARIVDELDVDSRNGRPYRLVIETRDGQMTLRYRTGGTFAALYRLEHATNPSMRAKKDSIVFKIVLNTDDLAIDDLGYGVLKKAEELGGGSIRVPTILSRGRLVGAGREFDGAVIQIVDAVDINKFPARGIDGIRPGIESSTVDAILDTTRVINDLGYVGFDLHLGNLSVDLVNGKRVVTYFDNGGFLPSEQARLGQLHFFAPADELVPRAPQLGGWRGQELQMDLINSLDARVGDQIRWQNVPGGKTRIRATEADLVGELAPEFLPTLPSIGLEIPLLRQRALDELAELTGTPPTGAGAADAVESVFGARQPRDLATDLFATNVGTVRELINSTGVKAPLRLFFLPTGSCNSDPAEPEGLWISTDERIADSGATLEEPVLIRFVQLTNDPYYSSQDSDGHADQWALRRVGHRADASWLPADASSRTIVAVIDTGVAWNHEEFDANSFWYNSGEIPENGRDDDGNGYVDDVIGWDFIHGHNLPWDLNGHGTFVSSVIAARSNNGRGIAGVDPRARLMVLKAFDRNGQGRSFAVAEAITYAVRNGARVINLSVGGQGLTQVEQMAVDFATANNVLVVAAAGNGGTLVTDFGPAANDHVFSVGATDRQNKRMAYSNFGPSLALAAPGEEVLGARAIATDLMANSGVTNYTAGENVLPFGYYKATGTSFSAPLVSGAASLLVAAEPDQDVVTLKRRLMQSATDIEVPGVDQYTGMGLLNVPAALASNPDFHIDARIDRVAVVEERYGPAIQVWGEANASEFSEAELSIGAGELPDEFGTLEGKIKNPVEGAGVLGVIDARKLMSEKSWTIRLVVRHKDGRSREARFLLDLG